MELQQQKFIFDGEECILIQMRDVSVTHELQKVKDEVALLQKLNLTISKDLIDPLNLIYLSVNWLITWYKEQTDSNKAVKESVLNNMINILTASKLCAFKCRDLLELSKNEEQHTN